MRDRSFADFMVGALTCISVLGLCAMLKESEPYQQQRARRSTEKWALPRKRRRRRSPEDDCRHCTGTGVCDECGPSPCRVCNGTGLQPHDESTVHRLTALWDGAA